MRRITGIIILLLLVSVFPSLFLVSPVFASSTVGETAEGCPFARSWAKNNFYSPTTGRFWVFYLNGTALGWKSLSGTWSDFTVLEDEISASYTSFSVWYEEGKSTVCVAWVKETGVLPGIYYREGVVNSDGTISWDSSANLVLSTTDAYAVSVMKFMKMGDAYPCISYQNYDSGTARPGMFVASSHINGISWGIPSKLWSGGGSEFTRIVPISGGIMALKVRANDPLKYRTYDPVETYWYGLAEASTCKIDEQFFFDAASVGGNVGVVFANDSEAEEMLFMMYAGTWDEEELVVENKTYYSSTTDFTLTHTSGYYGYRVYYRRNSTTINYRDRGYFGWGGIMTAETGETSVDVMSSSFEDYGGQISYCWRASSSPYLVRHNNASIEGTAVVDIEVQIDGAFSADTPIKIGGDSFYNGSAATVSDGVWPINGTSDLHGVSFINWYSTGYVAVSQLFVAETLMTVIGNGMLGVNLTASPVNENVTITNMEGCGDWVFTEEKYYYFQAFYLRYGPVWFDTVKIAFALPTQHGDLWANFTFDVVTNEWGVAHSPIVDPADLPTRVTMGTNKTVGSYFNVTFHVWFTQEALDVYLSDCVDIYMWCNDTEGKQDGWEEKATDYFHVYNFGGFSLTKTLSGQEQAGRLGGGDVFDLWATNGSGVQVDLYYRHLQHVKLRPEVQCIVGYPSFYLEYSVDYCTNTEDWIEGWKIRMDANAVTYGTERYFNWTVRWYFGGVYVDGTWQEVDMFHGGDAAAQGEVTYTWFWIDLWFNKENASSVVGGRINAYQWAMKDNANTWLRWLSSNWGPYDDLPKESMFFYELQNGTGGRLHTPEIKMVRVNCKLYAGYNSEQPAPQWVEVKNYQIFDPTIGDLQQPFRGVQTPTFEETVTPVMPMGGWIGALWTGLNWLGGWLADNLMWGGLSLWPRFVSFMDTIAAWLGFPNAFSNLVAWLASGWTLLVDSFSYLISLLGPAFTFLATVMPKFITLAAAAVTQWVAVIQGIYGFLNGTYTSGVNIFNDLGVMDWVILGLILYPIHLVILWDLEGFGAVEKEIRLIWDVAAWLISLFIQVIRVVIAVIGRIIESIPVVE